MMKIVKRTVRTASLCLALATVAILPALADNAEAGRMTGGKETERIVFASDRISGRGAQNPEGDLEIFTMNADGTNQRNVTNTAGSISDFDAALSPDGQTVAYVSAGVQPSNQEGDDEIFAINADGSGQKNLTNTANGVQDEFPDFAPDGRKVAFTSYGPQPSNPEGDAEVYVMDALEGTDQRNLTRTGGDIDDVQPDLEAAASD